MAGVSKATVKDYHAVQVQGSPELKEAVDCGEVAISDAARVARQQLPEQQTKALERNTCNCVWPAGTSLGEMDAIRAPSNS